ncbi:hypothetical protein ANN_24203 [Periplaneta americana]|uniref:DUF4817 domain-containing protein n=1 Tax=Periplaneta americana TaxID=6978 RepID=A0ABQ8S2F6_PERAM|nr:hypothetical protein ANN_24203 [Periplaneta americana]
MVLTTEEEVFIVEYYFRSYGLGHANGPSLKQVSDEFRDKFHKAPLGNAVLLQVVDKFRRTGSDLTRRKGCTDQPVTVTNNDTHVWLLTQVLQSPKRRDLRRICRARNIEYYSKFCNVFLGSQTYNATSLAAFLSPAQNDAPKFRHLTIQDKKASPSASKHSKNSEWLPSATCGLCRNASNNGHLSSLIRERESSLTSMQRFIMQRLRDRPPRYEDNNQIRLEKPPPYQETAGTESQLPGTWGTEPPEYSEVIGETTSNNNKSDPPRNEECRSGAENPGFSLQDEAPQSRHTETELHM